MSIDYDKWHSGPPPSIGWWPASPFYHYNRFRWWNGYKWSAGADSSMTSTQAGRVARMSSGFHNGNMLWRHRPPSWPKRSRT